MKCYYCHKDLPTKDLVVYRDYDQGGRVVDACDPCIEHRAKQDAKELGGCPYCGCTDPYIEDEFGNWPYCPDCGGV